MTTRRFRGGATAARQARRAVREELAGALPKRTLADVELLVSELATNSVRHAGCGEGDELAMEAAVEADRVRVRLFDTGDGFDAAHAAAAAERLLGRLRARAARPAVRPLGRPEGGRLQRLVRGPAGPATVRCR